MKILVCIKQVPDLESKLVINGTQIAETDLAFRMNEYDEFAVEEAVKLHEANAGSELVVLTLGPARASEALKKALAMGADRAIHLLDDQSNQKDPFQIASLIKAAVAGEGFDLVFTGQQSQDMGSAQVGILLAEMLGINGVTTVVKFELAGTTAKLQRELDGGLIAKVEADLPLLVTCQLGLNTPRYPTLPNIMKAKKKEIKNIEVASLNPPPTLGQTNALYAPAKKGSAEVIIGDPAQQAEKLVSILKSKSLA